MFKYTKAAVRMIIEDIKRYAKIFQYGSSVFIVIYYVYAFITQKGNIIANAILASLFVAYTIFVFFFAKHKNKKIQRIIRRSYKWINLGIKAFTLGVMIYGIYMATTDVTPINTILASLMIFLWVMQVLLELIIKIVQDKSDLFIAAWTKDLENMNPKKTVKKIFDKVRNKEVEEEKSPELLAIEEQIKVNKEKAKLKKVKQPANPAKPVIK